MTQPIFLVGPRGCGKTTVGSSWRVPVNVILLIPTTGCRLRPDKPSRISSKRGLESFRSRETAALEAVTAPDAVIATGGGIILAEYNRRFMREKGIVIYLCAPVVALVGRLEAFPEEGNVLR